VIAWLTIGLVAVLLLLILVIVRDATPGEGGAAIMGTIVPDLAYFLAFPISIRLLIKGVFRDV
jgi:hypothetical protein